MKRLDRLEDEGYVFSMVMEKLKVDQELRLAPGVTSVKLC